MGSEKELFLFVHIPKTGGQTLREFFRKHLVFHREFIHLGPYGLKQERQLGLQPFDRRPTAERVLARVILGHEVKRHTHKLVPGKIPRYVTFLRDPAETIVSYYNFAMAMNQRNGQPVMDFEPWYSATLTPNFVTKWLHAYFMQERTDAVSGREFKKVMKALDRFWFVGCTEYLDRDAPTLLQRMGLRGSLERTNVTGVHFERLLSLDSTLRQALYAKNSLDVELYTSWKERLPQSLDRVRQDYRRTSLRAMLSRLLGRGKT